MIDTKTEKRTFSSHEIKMLNAAYKSLSPLERIKKIYDDFAQEEIMLTSSFAATSAFLLKLLSEANPYQTVHFIDTGYHFDETLEYKAALTKRYGLKDVVSVSAIKEEHNFTTMDKTWSKNPDFCCYVNKVKPLEGVKEQHNIWISGLMKWQSDHRSSLDIFEMRSDILKFYPLVDIRKEERDEYIEKHNLPFHPLVAKGYHSIGCTHCTVPGEDREGRWNNNPKTECGLHL